ncbi:DUF190 domain-containing protein [bacterium]|nr:DUF190 domain-containing protein [bacterium]
MEKCIAKLMRVFISENDRHQGKPLFEWIIRQAQKHGMAGVTVLRGLEGFGADSHLHTAKVLRLASDLPIVIEIVDMKEKIQTFVDVLENVIEEGLITIENVEARFYRKN